MRAISIGSVHSMARMETRSKTSRTWVVALLLAAGIQPQDENADAPLDTRWLLLNEETAFDGYTTIAPSRVRVLPGVSRG